MTNLQPAFMRIKALLLIGWSIVWCSGCDCECEPDEVARELAGSGAINCASPDGVAAERECVAMALMESSPFVLRQQLQGIDSEVRRYLVGNARGQAFVGDYDSDPSGGSGSCEVFDITECGSAEIEPMPVPGNEAFFFLCNDPGPRRPFCD